MINPSNSELKSIISDLIQDHQASLSFEDLSTIIADELTKNYYMLGKDDSVWLSHRTNCYATGWGPCGNIVGLASDKDLVDAGRTVFSGYEQIKLVWIPESKMLYFKNEPSS